jgi:UDP-N-acetylmuramoylalanine--D-glutamate ligase
MKLQGKHVLILGLGESGLASARWCVKNGARVRVADTRAAPPGLSEICRLTNADFLSGAFTKSLLEGIDLVVISPGLSPGMMVVLHARAQGIPVVGEIELFAWALRDLAPLTPVLGITGTNGKTTTTTLTGHLIAKNKKTVGVAGNISPAALDALMVALDQRALPDVWVLELSSFQLETTESLNCAAAAMLNLSDDHLDRYIDLNDYATAKRRIFNGLGTQVLNRDDAWSRRMAIAGRRLISFGLDAPGDTLDFGLRTRNGETWIVQGEDFLLPVDALPLAGLHNATNAMAALALCVAIGFQVEDLVPALKSFKGLAHRVEKVAEINGITYYDDSKGTNVGATVAALEGLGCKSVVILGGDGKGQDFSPLKAAVARHAQGVVLIGRDAPKIQAAITGCGIPMQNAADMVEAVDLATRHAQPGDAVLLSPACASFDMYKNYEHRAEVFRAAVALLQAPGA